MYYQANSHNATPSIIDTAKNVYIFYYGGNWTYYSTCVIKVNKTNKTISRADHVSGNYNVPYTSWNGRGRVIMDEEELIYYNGGTYLSIDINDDTTNIIFNGYTWSINQANMIPLYDNFYYRASQNNISYLNEGAKTLEYFLKDGAGDIVNVQDVFVSTWDFDGWNMLRRDINGEQIFYLSIFWEDEATDGVDEQRIYNEYEIWAILDDEGVYYTQLVDNDTLFKIDVTDTTYDFRYWAYKPFIEVIDAGAWNQIYYLDRTTNTLYKETDVDLSDFLVDISGAGTSSSSSSSSGAGGTATGSYIAVDFDDSIFNFDIDGDGEVWVLNGEIFIGIWNVIKAFFSKIVDFFANLRGLLNKFSDAFTTEEKDFSFIPSANAQETLGEMLNNNVDQGEYEENALGKINIFIKWFIAFLVFVIGFAVFIWISKSKNG